MKFNANKKDPEGAKRKASQMGAKAGAAGTPEPNPDGSSAHSFAKDGFEGQSRSATVSNTADYLGTGRAKQDMGISQQVACLMKVTTETHEAGNKAEASTKALRKHEKKRNKAREEGKVPDPPWLKSENLRHAMSVLVGVISGVSVGAATLAGSQDSRELALAYGAGVGLLTVVVGEGVGRLLKKWHLNTKKDDQYIGTHPVAIGIIGFCIAALVGLMVAIGIIRMTASKADTAREANSSGNIVTYLPGQEASDPAALTDGPKPLPTIPWGAYIPLEAILVAAAIWLAWDGCDPDRDEDEQVRAVADEDRANLKRSREQLSQSLGLATGLIEVRTDKDNAVQAQNDATTEFAGVEWNAYAWSDELARAGRGPSPFVDRRPPETQLIAADQVGGPVSIQEYVRSRLGRSLTNYGVVTTASGEVVDVDNWVAVAIAEAIVELNRTIGGKPDKPGADSDAPLATVTPIESAPSAGDEETTDGDPEDVAIPEPDEVGIDTVVDPDDKDIL